MCIYIYIYIYISLPLAFRYALFEAAVYFAPALTKTEREVVGAPPITNDYMYVCVYIYIYIYIHVCIYVRIYIIIRMLI